MPICIFLSHIHAGSMGSTPTFFRAMNKTFDSETKQIRGKGKDNRKPLLSKLENSPPIITVAVCKHAKKSLPPAALSLSSSPRRRSKVAHIPKTGCHNQSQNPQR